MEALYATTVTTLDVIGEAVCGGANGGVRSWQASQGAGHLQAPATYLAGLCAAAGAGGQGRYAQGAGEPAVEGSTGHQGARSGFFQRCVAQNRGSTPARQREWRDCVYEEIASASPANLSLQHPLPLIEKNSANGIQRLLQLSHSRGSPHSRKMSIPYVAALAG